MRKSGSTPDGHGGEIDLRDKEVEDAAAAVDEEVSPRHEDKILPTTSQSSTGFRHSDTFSTPRGRPAGQGRVEGSGGGGGGGGGGRLSQPCDDDTSSLEDNNDDRVKKKRSQFDSPGAGAASDDGELDHIFALDFQEEEREEHEDEEAEQVFENTFFLVPDSMDQENIDFGDIVKRLDDEGQIGEALRGASSVEGATASGEGGGGGGVLPSHRRSDRPKRLPHHLRDNSTEQMSNRARSPQASSSSSTRSSSSSSSNGSAHGLQVSASATAQVEGSGGGGRQKRARAKSQKAPTSSSSSSSSSNNSAHGLQESASATAQVEGSGGGGAIMMRVDSFGFDEEGAHEKDDIFGFDKEGDFNFDKEDGDQGF